MKHTPSHLSSPKATLSPQGTKEMAYIGYLVAGWAVIHARLPFDFFYLFLAVGIRAGYIVNLPRWLDQVHSALDIGVELFIPDQLISLFFHFADVPVVVSSLLFFSEHLGLKFIKAGVRNPILQLLALRHIRRVDIELGGVADRQSLQPIKLRYFGLFNGKNVMFDQVFSVSNIAPHCDLHLVLALIKDKKRSFRFLLARLQLDHIGNRVVRDHANDVYQFVGLKCARMKY